jgi:hypothetical protein
LAVDCKISPILGQLADREPLAKSISSFIEPAMYSICLSMGANCKWWIQCCGAMMYSRALTADYLVASYETSRSVTPIEAPGSRTPNLREGAMRSRTS